MLIKQTLKRKALKRLSSCSKTFKNVMNRISPQVE